MTRKLFVISSLFFTLNACYTPPKLAVVPDAGMTAPCTGLEPSCRKMNVSISIDADASAKLSKEDKKLKAHSVFGRCELLVENPNHPPTVYPCTELRVSLTKVSGEERNTWLQGTNFEIRELTRGPYNFSAYSDQYMTGSSKNKINLGQPLLIEIRISPPSVKTATDISPEAPTQISN